MGSPDDEAFCEFVAARSTALLRTAYLIVGDRGHAEDLLQSALIKTYQAMPRIRDHTAIEAYVRRVLMTTAASRWRRRSTHERPVAVTRDEPTADPTDGYAETDRMRRLHDTLPVRQRAVLVLRFYLDMTESEVAAAMRISRGTVTRYIARGLEALRGRMREESLR